MVKDSLFNTAVANVLVLGLAVHILLIYRCLLPEESMRPSLLSAICSTLLLAYVFRVGKYLDFPSPYILIYLVCSHLSKDGMHSSVEYFIRVWTMDRVKKRNDRSTFSNLQLSKYSLPITHSYVGWFARFIKSMAVFWLRLNPYHSNSIVHALFQHVHTNCALYKQLFSYF